MTGAAGPSGLLTIGVPRSGFSLLLSVLNELRLAAGGPPSRRHEVWRILGDVLGSCVAARVVEVFERHGLGQRLLFNPNFRRLAGGPRWIDENDPAKVCFRKYLGVRGLGDFTLVIRLPAEILHGDDIVHSHTGAARWPEAAGFAGHRRFASVRNPFGILASAVFSINALASEHLTLNYPPDTDEEALRQSLALYKLTDRLFFGSLIDHMAREVRGFLPYAGAYHAMRWEDLIETPVPTILTIARAAGYETTPEAAEALWNRLAYRNLTGAHRHNFRKGHGIVGGWRNWLVDAHLAALRDAGVPQAMAEFGYDPDERIAPSSHTPFQDRVARALADGKPIDEIRDRDLFVFAFNKTNIDFSKFGFRIGAWRAHTRMERSSFADLRVERTACDAAETALTALTPLMDEFRAFEFDSPAAAVEADSVFDRHRSALEKVAGENFERARAACRTALEGVG